MPRTPLVEPLPFEGDFGPFAWAEASGGSAQVLLAIERFRPQPEGIAVRNGALRICRHLDAPLRFSRRARGGRFAPEFIAPGQHFVFGAASEAQFAWASGFRTLSFTIEAQLLAPLDGAGPEDAVSVRAEDPVLERLTALALLDAEQGFPRGPLFAEGLGLALAAHLAACGAEGRQGALPAARDTLGPGQLRALREAVEAALPGRVALAALAEAADHPAHRLGGAFRRATGASLWDYVAERRLARAEALLRDSSLSIGQAALRAGYSSQAHLTTSFRRLRGMTPSAWRAVWRG
jgi:AraC-like DNA-binding protein